MKWGVVVTTAACLLYTPVMHINYINDFVIIDSYCDYSVDLLIVFFVLGFYVVFISPNQSISHWSSVLFYEIWDSSGSRVKRNKEQGMR